MNLYFVIPFLAFAINLFALGHIMARDLGNPTHRSFLLLTVVATLWQLGGWIYYLPLDEDILLPAMRVQSIVWQFVGFCALNFAYRYTGRSPDLPYRALLAASAAFSILGVTTALVISGYTRYSWGVWFDGGPLYHASLLGTMIIPILYAPLLIHRARTRTRDALKRRQQRIIILGFASSMAAGAFFQFGLPFVLPSGYAVRYGSSAGATLTAFILYAMVKYRFLSPGPERIAGDLFHRTGDGVVILDGEGRVTQINPSAREMLGGEREPVSADGLSRIIEGYEPGADYTALRARARSRSGERVLSLSQSDIRLGGQSGGKILIIKDVTDENRALLALRESEERFRTMVEEISDAIYSMTLEGIITYVSPVIRQILGFDPEDMRGLRYHEFVHPDDLPGVLAHFERVLETPVKPCEYRARTVTGIYTHVIVTATPISFEGRQIGIRGVITDYEAMRAAQEALGESERRHRLIAQNVSDVIWTMDIPSLRMSYASPSVIRVLGQTVEENMNTPLEERISRASLSRALETLMDELAHDADRDPDRSRVVELEERHGDGRWIHTEARITFLRDAAGKPVELLGLTRDITAHKLLEEELRESLDEVRAKNEVIEKDLVAAQLIQRALLPDSVPANARLKIDYRYHPMAQVGGDFFNFIEFEEGGTGVFLGDVAGHGVPAALFLSLVKSTTNRLFRKYAFEPGAFMQALNEELVGSMQSYFITAIYALFRFDGGGTTLTLANGGHPHPLVYRHAAKTLELLNARGTLVGAFEGMNYDACSVNLEPGDRIYLYTDGFPEAMNARREIIGFDRLVDITRRAYRHELKGTLDAIIDEVETFRGSAPLADDLVVIAIEVL